MMFVRERGRANVDGRGRVKGRGKVMVKGSRRSRGRARVPSKTLFCFVNANS